MFVYVSKYPVELVFWICSIVYLAFIAPLNAAENHFTICPLAYFHLDFCPGCGLGESIILAFRGHFVPSFKAHPFGFFAIAVIFHRIYTLINIKQYRTTNP